MHNLVAYILEHKPQKLFLRDIMAIFYFIKNVDEINRYFCPDFLRRSMEHLIDFAILLKRRSLNDFYMKNPSEFRYPYGSFYWFCNLRLIEAEVLDFNDTFFRKEYLLKHLIQEDNDVALLASFVFLDYFLPLDLLYAWQLVSSDTPVDVLDVLCSIDVLTKLGGPEVLLRSCFSEFTGKVNLILLQAILDTGLLKSNEVPFSRSLLEAMLQLNHRLFLVEYQLVAASAAQQNPADKAALPKFIDQQLIKKYSDKRRALSSLILQRFDSMDSELLSGLLDLDVPTLNLISSLDNSYLFAAHLDMMKKSISFQQICKIALTSGYHTLMAHLHSYKQAVKQNNSWLLQAVQEDSQFRFEELLATRNIILYDFEENSYEVVIEALRKQNLDFLEIFFSPENMKLSQVRNALREPTVIEMVRRFSSSSVCMFMLSLVESLEKDKYPTVSDLFPVLHL